MDRGIAGCDFGLVDNLNLLTLKEFLLMVKGRYFIRECVYSCGDYLDIDIYPVFQKAGIRRNRCKPTREVQSVLNQKNAERKITRLIHQNFGESDLVLHLTYDEEGSLTAAQRDLYNFIRRVKRLRKKRALPELKYISCTERGKKSGRAHHHLLISGGIDRDELEALWGKGFANSRRLRLRDNGAAGLARYITKDRCFFKRWNQSKNLAIPSPLISDGKIVVSEADRLALEVAKGCGAVFFEGRYKGFRFTDAIAVENGVNRAWYAVHTRPPRARQIAVFCL